MYHLLQEGSSNATVDTLFAMAAGVANAATGAIKEPNAANKYSYSSIAKAASKLIAVFPILASRTVSAETAQMVSKYIEQKACNLFILGLQQANISNAKTGIEYLQGFHNNLNVGGNGVDAVINTMQTWVDAYERGKTFAESGSVSLNMYNNLNEDADYSFLFESDNDLQINSFELKSLMELMASNANIQFYDTKLNPLCINDFIVNEFADGNYHVSIRNYEALDEAKNNNGLRNAYRSRAKQMADNDYNSGNSSDWNSSYDNYRDQYKRMQDDADADKEKDYQDKKRRWEEDDRRTASARDYTRERERQEDRLNAKQDRDEQRAEKKQKAEDEKLARTTSGRNVSILKDQDIKKMNEAVPSLLVVKFYQSDTASVATEFIIGVKSKLIPVTTPEILRRIMNDNKDGKKFLKFMRVMTGELKAAETILGLSRIKDDLKSTRVKGAYGDTWNLLANRAKASREAVKQGKHNDYSAITTVLISQADADELFREENFDIADPKNALHFMDSYNIIAFIIADDSTETLKALFDDGSNQFEEISYRMLERESQDGTYKKLINLMAANK